MTLTQLTHTGEETLDFCRLGQAVIANELAAIQSLLTRVDEHFSTACRLMHDCSGRLIVMGMGKSGHIARKMAATLASTGSPSFFIHPAEASHGDMGMITKNDVVIIISNSGGTPEIVTLLPFLKRLNIPLIALTGNPTSLIAEAAHVNLDVSVQNEACPLGLAPTASTTAALVMSDALAIALLEFKGFTENDFALSHPGGTLGRRLLLRVSDIMRTGPAIPHVLPDTILSHALLVISEKRLGMTAICDESGKVLGIFTDGDLRRTLDQNYNVHNISLRDCMTTHFKSVTPDLLAVDALNLMEKYKITTLLVLENEKLCGVIHMHDLLSAGVV